MAKETEEGTRSFPVFLNEIDDGCFAAELGEELQKAVKQITEQAAQKCGTAKADITIKLKFKADEKGHVEVAPELTVKLPRPLRGVTRFWATPGNNLSTKNHRQPDLPFRAVDGGASEKPRGVDAPVAAKGV